MSELDILDSVFNLNTERRRDVAPEHLADTIDYTYEITINIPSLKMSLQEHLDVYKAVWDYLLTKYKPINDLYFVERCKSEQPHIHGYITVRYPINIVYYDDCHMLRDVAQTIFKILPKKYYKQYSKCKIFPHFRMLDTPAVRLNLKTILESNWTKYIEKNAPKK